MSTSADLTWIEKLAALIRHYILTATTNAGSGHPTSSLSAVELMAALFFGGIFRYDPDQPQHPNNDRLIFSKGHASPLLYALWVAAGKLSGEEMVLAPELLYREDRARGIDQKQAHADEEDAQHAHRHLVRMAAVFLQDLTSSAPFSCRISCTRALNLWPRAS